MTSAPPSPDDRRRLLIIARAERRRAMLERFAEQGMAIAGGLSLKAAPPGIGPEVVAVAEAFSRVSRAVRLTLILEAKLEQQILAYRNGDDEALDDREISALSRRRRGQNSARHADRGVGGGERDGDSEEAEFERLPTGGFKDWVVEICDELGLVAATSISAPARGSARYRGR